MKIASYFHEGTEALGQVDADAGTVTAFDLDQAEVAAGLAGLITRETLPACTGAPLALDAVRLAAPLRGAHQRVFCVGKNYYDHVQETEAPELRGKVAPPELPVIFSKLPQSIIGPGAPIRYDPEVSVNIDYEVELTAIIGVAGRNIPAGRALSHVWGYTILNDVTARDVQKRHNQWLLGKSQDTFCPIGPWVVTADEIDPANCVVSTHVNGEERQRASTALMIHDLPSIIATVSNGITLQAGDLIATGTPAGVGLGFTPPKFLTAGDVVSCAIEGIGVLENPVQKW
ncbi:MAG: fumarylacetoacetate hydrolase family protein [Pseudomonadota bacterium]